MITNAKSYLIVFSLFTLFFSGPIRADEDNEEKKEKQAIADSASNTLTTLDQILNSPDTYNLKNVEPFRYVVDYMKKISEQSTIDNESVFKFTEASIKVIDQYLNYSIFNQRVQLSELTMNDSDRSDPEKLKKLSRILIDKSGYEDPEANRLSTVVARIMGMRDDMIELKELSNTSRLHQNSKLSKDLTRDLVSLTESLANMVKQKSSVSDWDIAGMNNTFDSISDRYKKTKRFIFGIGASYDYIPRLQYTINAPLDLSGYEPISHMNGDDISPELMGTSDTYLNDLNSKAYTSLSLHFKMDYLQVNVAFPQTSEKVSNTSSVAVYENTSIEGEVLNQTVTTSEFDFRYDVSASISISDILFEFTKSPRYFAQADYGFSIGMSGVRVKDTYSHDVRVRNQNIAYVNLDNFAKFEETAINDFRLFYASIYYEVIPSDTLSAGIAVKLYASDSKSEYKLETDDWALGMYIRYYPILPEDWTIF